MIFFMKYHSSWLAFPLIKNTFLSTLKCLIVDADFIFGNFKGEIDFYLFFLKKKFLYFFILMKFTYFIVFVW